MRVLVTGVNGQLGYDVINQLKKRGHEVVGVDIQDMDITESAQVRQVIHAANVDAVVHCAAYTAVDAAEENIEMCRKVNAVGTENIAIICKELNIKMIYISTDYVFDGEGEEPWKPDDVKNPLNIYGKTKYEGELAVQNHLNKYYIVRISWVFGVNGKNFIRTMLNLGKSKKSLTVVDDQIGSPTYTYDLAILLSEMVEKEEYGIYHATNEGYCSWYDFAVEIFKQAGLSVDVQPVDSNMFPVKAKRPKNSRLDKQKLDEHGFDRLPHWQDAVARYIDILRERNEL